MNFYENILLGKDNEALKQALTEHNRNNPEYDNSVIDEFSKKLSPANEWNDRLKFALQVIKRFKDKVPENLNLQIEMLKNEILTKEEAGVILTMDEMSILNPEDRQSQEFIKSIKLEDLHIVGNQNIKNENFAAREKLKTSLGTNRHINAVSQISSLFQTDLLEIQKLYRAGMMGKKPENFVDLVRGKADTLMVNISFLKLEIPKAQDALRELRELNPGLITDEFERQIRELEVAYTEIADNLDKGGLEKFLNKVNHRDFDHDDFGKWLEQDGARMIASITTSVVLITTFMATLPVGGIGGIALVSALGAAGGILGGETYAAFYHELTDSENVQSRAVQITEKYGKLNTEAIQELVNTFGPEFFMNFASTFAIIGLGNLSGQGLKILVARYGGKEGLQGVIGEGAEIVQRNLVNLKNTFTMAEGGLEGTEKAIFNKLSRELLSEHLEEVIEGIMGEVGNQLDKRLGGIDIAGKKIGLGAILAYLTSLTMCMQGPSKPELHDAVSYFDESEGLYEPEKQNVVEEYYKNIPGASFERDNGDMIITIENDAGRNVTVLKPVNKDITPEVTRVSQLSLDDRIVEIEKKFGRQLTDEQKTWFREVHNPDHEFFQNIGEKKGLSFLKAKDEEAAKMMGCSLKEAAKLIREGYLGGIQRESIPNVVERGKSFEIVPIGRTLLYTKNTQTPFGMIFKRGSDFIIKGYAEGSPETVISGQVISWGRDTDPNLPRTVSGQHLKIRRNGDKVTIMDVSTNGLAYKIQLPSQSPQQRLNVEQREPLRVKLKIVEKLERAQIGDIILTRATNVRWRIIDIKRDSRGNLVSMSLQEVNDPSLTSTITEDDLRDPDENLGAFTDVIKSERKENQKLEEQVRNLQVGDLIITSFGVKHKVIDVTYDYEGNPRFRLLSQDNEKWELDLDQMPTFVNRIEKGSSPKGRSNIPQQRPGGGEQREAMNFKPSIVEKLERADIGDIILTRAPNVRWRIVDIRRDSRGGLSKMILQGENDRSLTSFIDQNDLNNPEENLMALTDVIKAEEVSRLAESNDYDQERRVLAIGDTNGRWETYWKCMRLTGVIDENGDLLPNANPVIHGDIMGDRSCDSFKIILHLSKLREQAAVQGQDFDVIAGNHDDFVFSWLLDRGGVHKNGLGPAMLYDQGRGLLEFTKFSGQRGKDGKSKMIESFFGPDFEGSRLNADEILNNMRNYPEGRAILEEISKWELCVRRKNRIHIHTDPTSEILELIKNEDIETINAKFQAVLRAKLLEGKAYDKERYNYLFDTFLDTNNRTLAEEQIRSLDSDLLNYFRDDLGINGFVFGHSDLGSGNRVQEYMGIQFINVDQHADDEGRISGARLETNGQITTGTRIIEEQGN